MICFSITGRLETGTKIADFCLHSLFVLEGLAHPRAHPLSNYVALAAQSVDGAGRRDLEATSFRGLGNGSRMFSGLQGSARFSGISDSDDDDHHEINTPILDQAKDIEQRQEPPSSLVDRSTEKIMNQSCDVTMICSQTFEVASEKSEEPGSLKVASSPPEEGIQEEPKEEEMNASDETVSVDKCNGMPNIDASDAAATSGAGKGKEIEGDADDDSPDDNMFPDIIDVEPESDED